MDFKKSLRQEGIVHGQTYSNMQKRGRVSNGRAPKQDKIDICINCTKENCTGTDRCFEKQKKKAE